jgi:uncharacterized protein YbjQ (UPF0145 family)
VLTFAYEKGDAKPYALVIESHGGERRTYRWATAQERDEAIRELPARPSAVEGGANAAVEPETPTPAATESGRAMALARTPFSSRTVVVAAACSTCGAAPLAVAADAPAFVRFPLVLLFFCFVPGTAVLNLLGPSRVPLEPGLVVATSLAISALTAQSMLWLGVWAPDAFLNALAAGSLAVIAVAHLREQAAHG